MYCQHMLEQLYLEYCLEVKKKVLITVIYVIRIFIYGPWNIPAVSVANFDKIRGTCFLSMQSDFLWGT